MKSSHHGFVFGRAEGTYIVKKEEMDGHILVVGGVGSGKSSCIAIPSLLAWRESVFCIDIKGELSKNTKHARKNARVFDPLNITYGYDPFYVLKDTDNIAQEVEAISMTLLPLPPNTKDPFWIESARAMLTGMMLHFYELGYTFIETMQAIQDTPINNLLVDIYCNSTSKEAVYYIIMFVGMEDKTLSSVYVTLSLQIKIFVTDKNVRECLSQPQNITPDDLEFGSDIFINIPEHLLRQWKNLITLIVNQFLRHFEKRPDMTARPILFLLDEFPRIGKMDGITDALATLRSKKITICPIIQSLAQLDLIYGKETRQVIADTCQYKAILGASEVDSQEYFSRLVGTHDETKTSKSKQQNIVGFPVGYGTLTNTEEKRIIKPEQFATLKDIVLLTSFGYYRVEKTPYYER